MMLKGTINSLSLYLNATELEQVASYKYLVVIITNNLSWQPHVTSMCKKSKEINWNVV